METVTTHEIEPEIAGPPPRAARLPWRTQLLLLLATALAVLLLAGGLRALLEAGRLEWVAARGRPVSARITEVRTGPGQPGQPALLTGLRYEYQDPFSGTTVRRFARVAAEPAGTDENLTPRMNSAKPPAPPRVRVGDPIPLRVAYWRGRSIEYVWRPAPYGKAVFLTFCGLLVMGVGVHLLRMLTRWRQRRGRLLAQGVAAVGTIVHKHAEVNDTPRYYLRFGYATVATGEKQELEEQVSREQWRRFEIGQPVTVLYDPERPDDAGLYALMKHG